MTGAELIATERKRQIEAEKMDIDAYKGGELLDGAICYINGYSAPGEDRIRELIKAGTLIAAEIDRQIMKLRKESRKNTGSYVGCPVDRENCCYAYETEARIRCRAIIGSCEKHGREQ
jgi:hypothetical protein